MKFYIKSLGCKTNQLEGQIITQSLEKAGFIETKNKNEADICIINSCTVTAHSDNQVSYLLKQIKRDNKKTKLVLTGCTAQNAKEGDFPEADLILGNREKLNIEKYIEFIFKENRKIFADDIFAQKKYFGKMLYKTTSTRPSLKIQDGCDNRCTYCLIPFARGNSRSETVDKIIEQVQIYKDEGKKEIVLTGIHIGQWGREFNLKLIHLLKEIEKTDILRYRLGSLYVNEIDDELFDFLVSSKKFCPHFHLSLQSLCDKTLGNMGRTYTKKEACDMILKIKSAFDLPFIGCDIITGFPDENENDFIETKNALEKCRVSYIHSFPYSKRTGTLAAKMQGQIPMHVKKNRTKELMALCNTLHKEFLSANENKQRTIIYEKMGKNGAYQGVSENYIKVYKKSDKNLQNTVEKVILSEFDELH
ncbi:MAG: tRNA (N(6)-L-threonylcarbamoyladenosine(37)-C(2))-methylthiotransferase MtaB [Candidatus Gastranaerophilales bacterium]|nr:tRNA (N(6)-L-threonylcarbamoyladenosine(37)-C(2))-methylthiotransferase MtaB [Candidatus Gastranaerophilales bacterium]